MHGYICSSPVYEYKGWTFEFKAMLGPWPLRKDGELRKYIPKTFWPVFEEWLELEDREQYRVGGGCERF